MTLLDGQPADTSDGFTVHTNTLPGAVRDQLPPSKTTVLTFHRAAPAPAGHAVLTRTDSTVEALARYVL